MILAQLSNNQQCSSPNEMTYGGIHTERLVFLFPRFGDFLKSFVPNLRTMEPLGITTVHM